MEIKEINVNDIKKGYNPRLSFNFDKLKESIKKIGLLEPVLVRSIGNSFEVVSGEQRWQILKQLKKKTIPVIVKKLTDEEAAHVAYIDNKERNDLTPYAEAKHMEYMKFEFNLSLNQLAVKYNDSKKEMLRLIQIATLPSEPFGAMLLKERTLHELSKLVSQNKLTEIFEEAFRKKSDKWSKEQLKEFQNEFKARQEEQIKLGIQALEREWTTAETERQVKNQLYIFQEKDEYIKKSARQKLTQAISQFREGIDKITNSIVRSVDGFKAFKQVMQLFSPEILEQVSEKDQKILSDELDTLEEELSHFDIKDINADIRWFRKNLKGG